MIVGLDHVVILVRDIEAGAAAYAALLGRKPAWRSADEGSESVLFTLANMSAELLAPAGSGIAADRIRAVLEQDGEGLASLCFRVDDIAGLRRRMDRLGLRPEGIADGDSRDAATGRTLRWTRTRAATDATFGVRLFFLEMAGARPGSDAIADAPVTSLDHVVVETAEPDRAGRRRDGAGDHVDDGGLAGPVRPQKTDDLARRHGEARIVDGDDAAEALGEAGYVEHRCHRGASAAGMSLAGSRRRRAHCASAHSRTPLGSR